MTLCKYGAAPKSTTGATILIDLYEGLNISAIVWLKVFTSERYYSFSAPTFCAIEPEAPVDFDNSDWYNPESLLSKLIRNKKIQAFYDFCECRAAPPPPEIPPDNQPDGLPPLPPYDSICFDYGFPYVKLKWRYWEGTGADIIGRMEVATFPTDSIGNISISPQGEYVGMYTVRLNGEFKININTNWGQDGNIGDYYYYFCGEEVVEPDPVKPDDPNLPDYCICACDDTELSAVIALLGELRISVDLLLGQECLKYGDFREGVADINLHTSESNTRISGEIYQALSETSFYLDNRMEYFKEQTSENIQSAYNALEDSANGRRNTIQGDIQSSYNSLYDAGVDSKNQILTGVGASTSAILAALAAGLVAISAEFAATVATITAEIGTAVATISTNISTAAESIKVDTKAKIDALYDKFKKLFEDYNPKRLYAMVSITNKPDNIAVTYGTGDTPDKYAFGWVVFVDKSDAQNPKYFERQYINFENTVFRCPKFGEKVDCVIYLQAGVTASLSKIFMVEKDD